MGWLGPFNKMGPMLLPLLALASIQPIAAPLVLREFRAAWVATVDNIDWPSKRGLATQQQKRELITILDTAKRINLNALIFQVRPHADAMYASRLEPWSEYLTGQQGKAPSPAWDPLEFIVKEGHKRGIEIHAWFNPYRAWHPKAVSRPAPNFIGTTRPQLVKQIGKFQWMDPGEKQVQDHSLAVIMDVVKRYDIDGVHLDDYFYPYKSYSPGLDFPDNLSWQRFLAAGGKLSRSDWRRKNVDDFVQKLYRSIKKERRWVKFGISPFGINRPGQPPDVKTTFDQYEQLYADARKWLAQGWVDYFSPQLYWRIKGDQPYGSLLDWWGSSNPMKRHLWPGLYTGRVSKELGDWPTSEIVQQVEMTRDTKGKATGNVHYSMQALTKRWKNIDQALSGKVYSEPALVPASPWLDSKPPPMPETTLQKTDDIYSMGVKSPPRDVAMMAFFTRREFEPWKLNEVLGVREKAKIHSLVFGPERFKGAGIALIDRAGNMGPIRVVIGG